MKIWYTAAELADLALPGLPATRENVARLAAREGWDRFTSLARPRQGRGGGLEYHLQLLPLQARVALLGPQGEAATASLFSAPDPRPDLPGAAILQRDARLAVIGAWRAFLRISGLRQTVATAAFADLYNARRVEVPTWVSETLPRLSARSLARWIATARFGEVDGLAVDRGAARRGRGTLDVALDGAVRLHALGLIAHNPHLSADHVRTVCIDRFGATLDVDGETVPFPGQRTFQLALARWRRDNSDALLAITNPDAFKSRRRVSGTYENRAPGLNAFWQIDASPVDALCLDGRHSVYICLDYWSRRIVTLVTRTPRSEALGLLMRKAILAWGVPDLVKTDNGSDFVSRWTCRLFAALQIETETSTPFSPEQKGAVERAIGTFQRDFCATLPGFVGHSVAQRKVIEARKSFAARLGTDDARAFRVELSAAELQERADAWAADRYAHRSHGGLDGQTPFARAASWPHPVRRIEDEAALAVLLAPVPGGDGLRVVGKQGLRIEGSWYLSPELMPGRQVFVRLDPADLGRVWCFEPDGETYLGEAICPELRGIDRAAALAEVRAAQKRLISEATAPIRREAARLRPRDVADAIARQAAQAAGRLVELPRPSRSVSTPALAAAAEVATDIASRSTMRPADQRPGPSADHETVARIEAEIGAGATPAPVRHLRAGPTPQQLYRRARALLDRLDAGGEIGTDDALWLGGYRESAAFRALDGLYREHGEAALR